MSHRNHRKSGRSIRPQSLVRRRRILAQAVEPMLMVESLEKRVLLAAPLVWTATGIGDGGSSFYAEVNPLNPAEMYLGSDIGEEGHTTNYDWTGTPSTSTGTWTILNSSQLQGAAIDSGTQFTNNLQIQYAISGNNLKKTTNDGGTWTTINGTGYTNGTAYHLLVDPNSANNLVVDSVSGGTWTDYYTSNGGQSFNEFATGSDSPNAWFAGAYWDDVSGTSPTNTLYFATNSGMWEATGLNSGSAWTWTQPSAFNNLAGGVVGTPTVNGSDQITGVNFTNNGHGYTNAPAVTFSGGGGSNAAGIAVLNSSGQVTSVTMTNEGIGYTGTPTVSFAHETYYSFNGSRVGTTTDLWATTWWSTGYSDPGGQPAQLGVGFATYFMNIYTANASATGWTNDQTLSNNFWDGGGPLGTAGIYPRYVQMIDGNINDIWIAGGKLNSGDTFGGPVIYGSTNGGDSWTSLFQDAAQSGGTPNENIYTHWLGDGGALNFGYGGDPTPLLVDRTLSSSGKVIMTFGVAGDAFRSDDGGLDWESITGSLADLNPTGSNVPAGKSYSATYNESVNDYLAFPTPNVIISGAADGLSEVSTNGGVSWQFPNTSAIPNGFNELYEPTYDPNNGIIYAVTSSIHLLYNYDDNIGSVNPGQSISSDYLIMSPDDGVTWSLVHAFNAPARTITLDPDNTNIMYVGTADYAYGGIWETTDLQDGANSVWARLGDGTGVVATADVSSAGAVTSVTLVNGGTGYTQSAIQVYFNGYTNNASASVTVGSGGTITSISMTNDGSGYSSSSPPTLYITSATDEPTRGAGFNNSLSGQPGTFDAQHPIDMYITKDDDGDMVAVAVMSISDVSYDVPIEYSGVWTAISTNQGLTWSAWNDVTAPDSLSSGGSHTMSQDLADVVIDPNHPDILYATVAEPQASPGNPVGDIYKGTLAANGTSVSWAAWTTPADGIPGTPGESGDPGMAWGIYLMPGTNEMYVGGESGLDYTANDYGTNTTLTPTFVQLTNMPLGGDQGIYGNPWVPGQIWITDGSGGDYYANTNSLAAVNPPTNVTAQALNGTQVQVSWTTNAPYPNSYLIQDSTNGGTTWSNAATVPGGYDSSYLVTGLTANTQYKFQVIAIEGLAPDTVLSVNISAGGANYTSAPTATFNNTGTGGSGAAGTAIVENGAVTGFTITNAGTGYTSAPTVTFSNGGGTGATGAPAISNSYASNISNAVRTDSTSALIASEGFGESTGTLNGATGGTGWSGGWSSSGWNISSGNLTAQSGLILPNTSGGNYASVVNGSSNAIRTLSSTVGTTGTVLWVSFEDQETNDSNAGLLLGNTTNGIAIGGYTEPAITIYSGGVATTYTDTTPITWGGVANFFVARIDFESTGMAIQLYLNPMPGLTNPTAQSQITTFSSGWNGQTTLNPFGTTGTTTVTMLTNISDGTMAYDEIRIGGTYLEVAPYTVTAPSAPTGMAATVISVNEVDLAWTDTAPSTDNAGEAGSYIVLEKIGSGSYNAIDTIHSNTIDSYQVTNLTPNTSYTFEVEANNTAGTSSPDASSAVTTQNNAVPTGVVSGVGVTVSGSTFNVTWSNTVSGATGYYVEYSNDFPSPFDVDLVQWTTSAPLGNVSSYSISSGLATNIPYYFRIIPYNAAGTGIGTLGVPLDYVTQVAFAGPTVTAAQGVSNNSATVSWTDVVPGIGTYNFQYSSNFGATWTSGGSVTAASVAGETPYEYLITGLSADTQYEFEVQASATGSTGAWSTPTTASTARTFSTPSGLVAYEGFDYPYIPTSATDLQGQNGGSGWSSGWSVTGVDGNDEITSGSLVSPSNSGTVAGVLLTTGNDLSMYTGDNILANRTFTSALSTSTGSSVWVSVLEQYSSTPETNTVTLDTSGSNIEIGLPYERGSDLNVQTTGSTQDNFNSGVLPTAGDTYWLVFEITYTSTNASTINFWVDPNPTTTSPTSAVGSATGSYAFTAPITAVTIAPSGDEMTYDELRVGTTYASVSPLALPQTPVQTAPTPESGSVVLNWTEANNPTGILTGYNIWRSTNDTSFGSTPLATVGSSATTYTDSSGTAGTTYYYAITAYNATGDTLYSNIENYSSLIAYEGFNYTYVSGSTTDLQGQSGGTGWSGGWSASSGGGDYDIASGSLVDTNTTVADNLLTSGNSMSAGRGNSATRTLASALSTSSGSSVWVSVLEQYDNTTNSPYGYVDLVGGSSGSNIYFGLTPTFPNDYSIHTTGSIQDSYNTGVAPTAGDTYWMVFEITYGATNTVSLWVDPNPTLSSPSSSTSTSGSWIIAAPQITAVTIDGAGNSGDINEWDELRIGSTWASVAPTISGGGDDIISRGKVTGAAPLASSAATTPAGSAGTTVVSDPPIAPIAAAKPFAATSATISTSDGSSPVSDPPLTAVAVQNNSAGSPFLTASSPSNAGGDGDSGGNMVDSLMADNSDDLLLNQKSSQRSSVFR